MQEILDYSVFGNTIHSYLISLGILIGGITVLYVFKRYILIRLRKWADSTDTAIDDLLVDAIERALVPVLYFGIVYASLYMLNLSPEFKHGLQVAAIVLITLFSVRVATAAVNRGLQSYLKVSSDVVGERHLKGISGLINIVIWVLATVFLLDNLGVKISAVVAGLGIGGIAVALASQAVLGDLFSYFVIFFDKPFEIGDSIAVGDKIGIVEQIGIKTTRLQAQGGEQLVISNTDLTNSRLHNFKKMGKRRVVFKLGIIYQTPAEVLKSIPTIVKDIIEKQAGTTFDRGHFASYGDSSLNFEFVYFVTGADYNKYMDIQQSINLSIFDEFAKNGIEFAYPSQTLFVNKAD